MRIPASITFKALVELMVLQLVGKRGKEQKKNPNPFFSLILVFSLSSST